MTKKINKIVRDKIPEIIKKDGRIPIYTTLVDEPNSVKQKLLLKKLKEEIAELKSSTSKEEIILELADIFEVCEALAKLSGNEVIWKRLENVYQNRLLPLSHKDFLSDYRENLLLLQLLFIINENKISFNDILKAKNDKIKTNGTFKKMIFLKSIKNNN